MAASEIHPTAVIDPSAELGEGVVVGPHCVIHAGAKIGDGCWLQNHVTVDGPTEIGPDNRFYAYASIGQRTQDLKYEGEPTWLRIGRGNTFREFVTVNRATSPGDATVIGNEGNFLAYTHIGHDCLVGDHVIFSNNSTLGGHVEVGDRVVLGGLTGIHQFCRIGHHAITGGMTKIVQDVPPYFMADGNPARVRAVNVVGMQRHGYVDDAIRSAKNALKKLYRADLGRNEAIEALRGFEDPHGVITSITDFVAKSERGIH